jgi:RhtB (resistance to homoserine/threonine) family protein
MIADYWSEFLLVAAAHLVAVVSPGPDFALVLRQSINHGRATAIWTSLGIGTGILFHETYSLLGLALLIRGSGFWFDAVKYAGAIYLTWVGLNALRTPPRKVMGIDLTAAPPARRGAFLTGWLVNMLNPKAMLLFIALFSVVVSPATPLLVKTSYGLWMAFATMAWFSLVAVAFTQPKVRHAFLRSGHWFDRVTGVLFLLFAVRLVMLSLG